MDMESEAMEERLVPKFSNISPENIEQLVSHPGYFVAETVKSAFDGYCNYFKQVEESFDAVREQVLQQWMDDQYNEARENE